MNRKLICSGKESNILEIHHSNSIISSYYDMSAPIQFTMTYCSGMTELDYYNVMSVSPNKDYFFSSLINPEFHDFNSRPLHQHAFFELLLVLEGSISQKLEDKEYLYPSGTCCLINQNVFHIEKYIGEAKLFFIGLSVNFIRELLESRQTFYCQREEKAWDNSILQFMSANIHLEKGKNYLDFFPSYQNSKCVSELHRLSDQLLHAIMLPKLGAAYTIRGLICELLQYLDTEESYHTSSVMLNTSSDQLLFSRIGHLMEDTDGKMSRSALEKALCYSGNYINSVVQKYAGMCLYEYGLTFTLRKAARLLKETGQPISAIETQLGFTNRTHFYKIFKKKYGVTPGEYRKNHKLV